MIVMIKCPLILFRFTKKEEFPCRPYMSTLTQWMTLQLQLMKSYESKWTSCKVLCNVLHILPWKFHEGNSPWVTSWFLKDQRRSSVVCFTQGFAFSLADTRKARTHGKLIEFDETGSSLARHGKMTCTLAVAFRLENTCALRLWASYKGAQRILYLLLGSQYHMLLLLLCNFRQRTQNYPPQNRSDQVLVNPQQRLPNSEACYDALKYFMIP